MKVCVSVNQTAMHIMLLHRFGIFYIQRFGMFYIYHDSLFKNLIENMFGDRNLS